MFNVNLTRAMCASRVQLRDCEMGAIVNRDLRQRVRPVNGVTSHKQVIKADIKHAARIVHSLDTKWGIWEEKGEEKKDKTKEEVCGMQMTVYMCFLCVLSSLSTTSNQWINKKSMLVAT